MNTANRYLRGTVDYFSKTAHSFIRFLGRILKLENRHFNTAVNFYLSSPQFVSFFGKDFEHRKSLFKRNCRFLYLNRVQFLWFFGKDFEPQNHPFKAAVILT